MNFPRETTIKLCAWINYKETFINLKENRKIPKEKKWKDLYRAKQTPKEKGITFSRSRDREWFVVKTEENREQSRDRREFNW